MSFKFLSRVPGTGWIGIGLSGFVWLLIGLVNLSFSPFLGFAPGVDILYLPAGIRLVLVLLFRVWAAIGISLADVLLYPLVFGETSFGLILANSIIAGFVPLGALMIGSRIWNVDPNLARLTPIALLTVALLASVMTPLMYNLLIWAVGHGAGGIILARFAAMMLGDFLGCLAVILILWLGIRIYRRL